MSRVYVLKIVLCCLLIIINGCMSASSSESLPESDHPYANNFEYLWPDINELGATQIRLHFENLDLASYDKLILYDKYDNRLVTYDRFDSSRDFWTDWYAGDTIKVKLVTDNSKTDNGFKIDDVETRSDMGIFDSSLAESYHPYANNFKYTWPDVNKPGAAQIRLHFENLDLASYDKLVLYDKYDNRLVTYDRFDSGRDFWTEWYAGDIIKIKLVTDNSGTDYGFKIDKGEVKDENNVTTVFTESTKTLDPITKKLFDQSGEDPDSSQNFTDSDYIHNQFVKIAVTLNILEEEDKDSWMYKNIQWIFSGIGVFFLGGISGLVKEWRDKKSKGKTSENK